MHTLFSTHRRLSIVLLITLLAAASCEDEDPGERRVGADTSEGDTQLSEDTAEDGVTNDTAEDSGASDTTEDATDTAEDTVADTVEDTAPEDTVEVIDYGDRPTAQSASVTLREDTPTAIALEATDPEDNPITFAIATQPSNGTLTLSEGGVARYVPEVDYVGEDSFTFTAADEEGAGDPATITLTVTEGTWYYVSETGDDSDDGTSPETAFGSMNHAALQFDADANDTIRLLPGVHPFGVVNVTTGGTIEGDSDSDPSVSALTCIINEQGFVESAYANRDTILASLTMRNLTVTGCEGTMLRFFADEALFEDLIFKDNIKDTSFGEIIKAFTPTVTVRRIATPGTNNGSLIFLSGAALVEDVTIDGVTAPAFNYSASENFDGTLTVRDSVFRNVTGKSVIGSANPVVIERSSFEDNDLQRRILSTWTTITDSTFTNNSSVEGPLFGDIRGNVVFERNTLTGNTREGIADAALFRTVTGGNLSLVNNTISGNGCGTCGPLFFGESGSGIELVNNTIVDNDMSAITRMIRGEGSPTIILNNNLLLTTAGQLVCGTDLSVLSGGGNHTTGESCNLLSNDTPYATDPMLGPLADNGGLTRTRLPMEGSPAIDDGENSACATEDQRGLSRPADGGGGALCDVGAVEIQ